MVAFRIPIKDVIFERLYDIYVEDAIQVPRELTKPDLSKIKDIVRKSKGQKKIPGVKIRITEAVYVR